MKETNQLKAGVILSYLNMGISMVIPMLYTPVMLRMMGQTEYGLYHLSNSVISYLSLLNMGMGTAILRYLMKFRADGDQVGFQRMAGLFQTIYGIIALVSVAVGLSLTGFTGTLFAQGLTAQEVQKMNLLIVIMSVSTGISFAGSVYNSMIYCYERHIFQKTTSIVGTIALPLLNLAALYCGFASVGLAVIGVLLSAATQLINVWYCVKKLGVMPRFDNMPFALLKEILPFSLFMFMSMIADMLFWAIDKVFIGALIGTAAVAVYNIGGTFQGVMQSMNGAISGVFAPRVNQIVFSGQPMSSNSEWLIRVGRIQYLILSLILSGFVIFGRQFVGIWAGAGYGEAYYVALLTMFPMAIPLIQSTAFNTITAMNRHQFRAVLYLIMAVANAVSTYFLIPVMGVTGAALCTCIAMVLGHGLVLNWFYYKKIGLDIPGFWKNILRMSIVPAGLAAAWMLLKLPIYDLWGMLLQIVIYTAIFCGLSWLFTMNRYEKDLVLGLVRKVLPLKGKK